MPTNQQTRFSRARAFDLSLAAVWLILDQLTKAWAQANLDRPVELLPGLLSLSLSHNTGALFGIMGDWPDPWRAILLTFLPGLAVLLIIYLLLRTPVVDRLTRLGLALILGGAVGNVLDRIVRGYVVDFIDLYWSFAPLNELLIGTFGTEHWPTFNVADSGLTCGALLLVADLWRRRSEVQDREHAAVPH